MPRPRKRWRAKYFKLREDVKQKLELLAEAFNISETEVVERLIEQAYRARFGALEPKLARLILQARARL